LIAFIIVEFVNTLRGANLVAFITAYALIVIYYRQIVGNRHRSCGAFFFARAAGYAAVFANAANLFTAPRVGASHKHLSAYRNPAYNLFGASRNASAASHALSVIHNRRAAVFIHAHGVVLAIFVATPQTHTAHAASLVAARHKLRGLAVAEALIRILVGALVAAVAMHHRHELFLRRHRLPQNFGDISLILGGRGITAAYIRLAVYERRRELVAARIAATAAIYSRQIPRRVVDSRVALNLDFIAQKVKEKSYHAGDKNKQQYGNYEF
jgi:hypothetical protein